MSAVVLQQSEPVRRLPAARQKRQAAEARERDLAASHEQAEGELGKAVADGMSDTSPEAETRIADARARRDELGRELHDQGLVIRALRAAEAAAEHDDAQDMARERAEELRERGEQILRRSVRFVGYANQAHLELQAIERELGLIIELAPSPPRGAAYAEWRQRPYLACEELLSPGRIGELPSKLKAFLESL